MDWEGFFTNYRKPGFIPGYEIVNKLGSGVFGEVYKARKESIGKFYAIKFLKVSDEKISEAIFKELDALRYFAQLDHPNLVTIEDQGEVMGIPFIVMGYAGDETLKRALSQGALSDTEVSEIFRQLCSGVAALHEKSIIHFDLKPANVFMKGQHARVGDYGLSKLVSESHKTMSIGRGTPYYMAPEMLRRKGDHRSDIYSLGVILFEMIVGKVPFEGDSEWEVLKKHETDPVVIPASVSSPYREVIEACLKKRPEERPGRVEEVLAMLGGAGLSAVSGTGAQPLAMGASSRTTPPPLPKTKARKSGPAKQQIRTHLGEMIKRVENQGGAAATRAKELYEKAGPAGNPGQANSFYTDFDAPKEVEAEDPDDEPLADWAGRKLSEQEHRHEADVETGGAAEDGQRGLGFFGLIFWPFRMLLKGLAGFFKMLWRGTRVFFANFLRYVVIIALTAGLAAGVVYLIQGPSAF